MVRAVAVLALGVACLACGSSPEPSGPSGGDGGEPGAHSGGSGGGGSTGEEGGAPSQGGSGGEGDVEGGSGGSEPVHSGGTHSKGGTSSGGTSSGGTHSKGGTSSGGTGGGTAGASGGNGAMAGASGSGSGGEGGAPVCAGCDGPCLDDGTCVECRLDTDCGAGTPRCDPDTNACVECLADADNCAAGSYCGDDRQCAPGCKDDASCGSGVCTSTHDCERCVNDSECAAGRVCATGVCSEPCSTEGAACGDERTCCSGRCVDTSRDVGHCGACAATSAVATCEASDFCGGGSCQPAQVASLCSIPNVAVIRGSAAPDDAAGDRLGAAFASCAVAPRVREVLQSVPDVANASTGQPVAGSGELIVVAGGPYTQNVARYLESSGIAPVRHLLEAGHFELHHTSGEVLASMPIESSSTTHDFALIEVIRDRHSSTPVLIVSGFTEGGTAAGAWYFEKVMMPALATFEAGYYVFEWTDAGEPGADSVDEFVPLASGP